MTNYKLTEDSQELIDNNPEVFKKWIAGLRSGKYTQITDIMCDEDEPDSACCLHVFEIECNNRKWEEGIGKSLPSCLKDYFIFEDANFSMNTPQDLEAYDEDNDVHSPAAWNDELRFSFDQIADLLENREMTVENNDD